RRRAARPEGRGDLPQGARGGIWRAHQVGRPRLRRPRVRSVADRRRDVSRLCDLAASRKIKFLTGFSSAAMALEIGRSYGERARRLRPQRGDEGIRRRHEAPPGDRPMFAQITDPLGNLFFTWLVALIPVVLLLVLLAGFRLSAWLAVLIGSIVTFLLGLWVWQMPLGDGTLAYLYGSATGVWNVDWITFWGVVLFNTMVVTG